MDTLFITSFHPLISRNILRTGILDMLSARNLRIVLFVPADKAEHFKKEFERPGIEVQGISTSFAAAGRGSFFFKRLARAMFGVRMDFITKHKKARRPAKEFLQELFFYAPAEFLGKFRFFRQLMRRADYTLVRDRRFGGFFEAFKPKLLFSTDAQNEHDVAFMKAARRWGIPVVSMVRSWDNLNVHGLLRFAPDRLLVTTEILKNEAIRFNDMRPEKISVIGIPHYDRYRKGPTVTREAFLKSLGANPGKRLILYCPIGDMYVRDNDVDGLVLKTLADYDATILVRLPPTDVVTFQGFKESPNVVFYKPGVVVSSRKTAGEEVGRREMSRGDDDHLINTMSFADVVVVGPSTIIVDAAFFDRPVVMVGFDGERKRPYAEGMLQYYDYYYMRPVVESGGARLARSVEEMKDAVDRYLKNPKLDHEGRARIVREECFSGDGRSTERLLETLVLEMKQA